MDVTRTFKICVLQLSMICYALCETCPTNCKQGQTCGEDSDCPYGGCVPGWWGRKCEHPLECEVTPVTYRGTRNYSASNKTCQSWSSFPKKHPPDGAEAKNYCRKADNDNFLWCYPVNQTMWERCNIPKCDTQCPSPDLQPHSAVKVIPKDGFKIGLSINIECDVGYQLHTNCHESYLQTNIQDGDGQQYCSNICQKNKTWLYRFPKCLRICTAPDALIQSKIQGHTSRTVYVEGNVIQITCQPNYMVVNGSDITNLLCQSNGEWNDTVPVCVATCQKPAIDTHSTIENELPIYIYKDKIVVRCKAGYDANGPQYFECQDDTNWNGTVSTCSDSSRTAKIVGGIIGGVLGFAVIVAVVFIERKRRKKTTKENKYRPSSPVDRKGSVGVVYAGGNLNAPLDDVYANTNAEHRMSNQYYGFSPDQSPSKNAIKVEGFAEYVRKRLENEEKLVQEYQTLERDLQMAVTDAQKPGNRRKNKYKNMYPYDGNRVKLSLLPDQPDSDYINASYIDGCACIGKYIAAQGPIATSMDDFWRMIWELNVKKIVMLTNVYEEGKKKCEHYWPDDESKTFGDIEISLAKEDKFCDYTIRTVTMKKLDTSRKVVQYHFTSWPDKGVPKSGSSLISIRNKVFSGEGSHQGPTVVHCSAGVGRTGTFIALDYLIDQATATNYVDVYECVATLRRQRINMVQTKEQYIFLHEVLVEALVYSSYSVTRDEYPSAYKSFVSGDKLKMMYKTLQIVTPTIHEKEFSTGQLKENKNKNRLNRIIAVNSERPILTRISNEDSDYINAVYIPSFRDYRSFVITQMPLANTVTDFWRLLWDHEVSTIVMLNEEEDTTCGIYWPTSEKPATFGPFCVVVGSKEECSFGSIWDLAVNYKQENRMVKQYRCTVWPDTSSIPKSTIQFLDLLRISQVQREEKPTVVHCLSGVEKSGLYCTLVSAIQQLEAEQEVDMPRIIRRLRYACSQIIPNLEQFRFCYDAVMEYLNQSSIYQNV